MWFGRTQTARKGTIEENATFLLAGIAAERRYNPRATDKHWSGDQQDFYALFSDQENLDNQWLAYYFKTEDLIKRNWRAVEAVASALLAAENYRLSAEDVTLIIQQTQNVKPI